MAEGDLRSRLQRQNAERFFKEHSENKEAHAEPKAIEQEEPAKQKCRFCGTETLGSNVCHRCLDNPTRQEFLTKMKELSKELKPEDIIDILGSTIKKDDSTKLNVFLDALLTYTEDEQQNDGLIAGSSTGKSYIPLELLPYFPEGDVIKLGYSSPTSFFHQNGLWMRDPRLPPLPEGYEEEEDEEEAKKRKAKENLIVIDLEKKILVFLDAPHSELLKNMRSLLSHDDKHIELRVTDRSQKSGLRTKRVLLIGFPTVIFCSANTLLDEQEKTRLNLYSPESTQEKIREAIAYKIHRDGNREVYKKAIEENFQRKILQERITSIKTSEFKHIIIPEELQAKINQKFLEMHSVLQPRHQRDIGKLMAKIKAFALLNFEYRNHKEQEYVEVNEEDVINGFAQYETFRESNELGLPPELYNFYMEIKDEFLSPGLTIDEFQKAYFENFKVLLGRDKARAILKAYTTVGLLVEVPDALHKRKIRYMCGGVGVTKEDEQENGEVQPPPVHTYSFPEEAS
jgi:hypothetical protein